MMDEYERYEAESNKIKKKNKQTMREFHEWLKVKEYTAKTINVHIRNNDFYNNVFLIYYDICKPEDGAHKIDSFLGYWFIHKAMWATVSSIKT